MTMCVSVGKREGVAGWVGGKPLREFGCPVSRASEKALSLYFFVAVTDFVLSGCLQMGPGASHSPDPPRAAQRDPAPSIAALPQKQSH